MVWTVHVRGINESDTQFERPVDCGDGLGVVALPVEVGHAHAAEAEGGDAGTILTESASEHARSLPSGTEK